LVLFPHICYHDNSAIWFYGLMGKGRKGKNRLSRKYELKVSAQELAFDAAQGDLLENLDYYVEVIEANLDSFVARSFAIITKSYPYSKQGVYIWGEVGRGKSLVMDMFYQHLAIEQKKRMHFHDMMLYLHQELELLRQQRRPDPIKEFARAFARECKVLCIDEMQVNNIADAMVLERLFRALAHYHVFAVFTSNRPPEDLFKDGLQRERFLPFINMLQDEYMVYNLNAKKDYREDASEIHTDGNYFYPLNSEVEKNFNAKVTAIMADVSNIEKDVHLTLETGRRIHCVNHGIDYLESTFDQLCGQPLGVVDYQEIAREYKIIVMRNIPKMGKDQHNEALRLISLIDYLYDNEVKALILAAAAPAELYGGSKNRFEFDRTISRLEEMKSWS
jgi:cell division protein ZapE